MRRILTVTLNPALDVSTEVERVVAGLKLRCAPPRTDPGGGGVNVSRAIRFLGGDSASLVAVGGADGAALTALLRAEGLAPSTFETGRETRRSLAVRDLSDGRQYRFLLPGAPWDAATAEAAAAAIAAHARPGDLAVLSGSLPAGAPDGLYGEIVARLARAGAEALLDTSGAPLTLAARGLGPPLAALRMDDAEAEALAGEPLPDAAATSALAGALVARGAAAVVAVARGAEGTVVADAAGRWLCAPPPVPVVSAVGAGDSFVAAFALALAGGAPADEACARGVAAAAAAVTTPDTRLCDRETFDRLLPLVRVARL